MYDSFFFLFSEVSRAHFFMALSFGKIPDFMSFHGFRRGSHIPQTIVPKSFGIFGYFNLWIVRCFFHRRRQT